MSALPVEQPHRTIYQVVDDQGQPYKAAHTDPLWVDRTKTDVFAEPTAGNKITPFTTGKKYFADLITSCDAATSEIYIAGWQVNWDALLNDKGLRLYDLLYRCAKRGVNIYVMPWDDTEPVQTYDDQTKIVLESINERLEKAGAKGRLYVNLCKSYSKINNGYFSHHQKQVLIDSKIAYIGGMDLAYGRFDDATYNLVADNEGRQVLNRYNSCIPPMGEVKQNDPRVVLVDPDLMSGPSDTSDVVDPDTGTVIAPSNASAQKANIEAGGWQVRYKPAGTAGIITNTGADDTDYAELNEKNQPRMPWQDVHSKIEGPAVSDLLRNFVLRWNTVAKKNKLKLPKPPTEFPQVGKTEIQVLRSAPQNHCATENKANGIGAAAKTQQDIHVAMVNLIAKARHFIYIENQFFVSNFGQLGGPTRTLSPAAQYIKNGAGGISDTGLRGARAFSHGNHEVMDELPQNSVLKALLARLEDAIVHDITKPKFHVYITLPVHPEGSLTDGTIATQVYYTMQTIAFGSHSLINGIKRCIKARELKDNKNPHYMDVINDPKSTEHENVSTEACYEYVTLLNLRNWAQLGSNYVTEQIYVHSKLMIVDDRFALLGSANINDRSLLGERDSEIAVLVMDMDTSRADINGKGSNQPVRKYAHELRKEIWSKLFGITGGVRAADLQDAIDAPGSPDSWRAIQKQAAQNTELYEAAFDFIPRNWSGRMNKDGDPAPASIIPNWSPEASNPKKPDIKGYPAAPLPCQDEFWSAPRYDASASHLTKVRGFITALPVEWTKGENNRIPYPTALLVQNEKIKANQQEPETAIALNETTELSSKG
ncbi:MAG: phospholipase D-like domain-containing protein [Burkholderiaceae bacterium]